MQIITALHRLRSASSRGYHSPLLCLFGLFFFVPRMLNGQAPDVEVIANGHDDIDLKPR
jgi:hypothetical protein